MFPLLCPNQNPGSSLIYIYIHIREKIGVIAKERGRFKGSSPENWQILEGASHKKMGIFVGPKAHIFTNIRDFGAYFRKFWEISHI